MAHGFNSVVLKRGAMAVGCGKGGAKGSIGSRRIFAPHFKLQVLDSYRNDADCKGNQRATARKYGIHRRQIQKWLQVEGNLRSSVGSRGKGEQGAGGFPVALGHQERTCIGATEARVPALSPQEAAPLDCSTRRSVDLASPHVASPEAPPLSPADQWRAAVTAAAVADSAGSAGPHAPASDPAAPIDLSLKRPAVAAGSAPAIRPCLSPRAPSPPSLAQRPHPDVWDLSTKRKCESPPPPSTSSRPPFKLFKPYLDDVSSSSGSTSSCEDGTSNRPCIPPCCAPQPAFPSYHPPEHNNNNTYALHELQPPSSITYFYTFPAPHHPSDYDMLCAAAPYEEYPQAPFKQRHSYSLDFKLSAIECYYQDSVCRGNQRAVATKYNIHRRQVQKWLKQADELRQKNETMKQTTVR